jgi:four helix bundle protein
MQDYRKLVVWSRAHSFVLSAYRAIRMFPPDERFSLTAQTRRALISIPANIAEGRSRASERSFASFLDIAGSSAAGVDYLLLLAHELGYLDPRTYQPPGEQVVDVRRMLNPLQAIVSDRAERRQPRR